MAAMMSFAVPSLAADEHRSLPAHDSELQVYETWHQQRVQSPPPAVGCWQVSYPDKVWVQQVCHKTTALLSQTRRLRPANFNTVGNGLDYAAQTASMTKAAAGSFPVAKGVEFISNTPDDKAGLDFYSLQLNTNFSEPAFKLGNNSPYCARHGYSECATWQQFVYLSNGNIDDPNNHVIFIQNWLYIPGTVNCPTGWRTAERGGKDKETSCVKNSESAIVRPVLTGADLKNVKLSGSVIKQGLDTVMFTYSKQIYAVTQDDSTLEIASTWRASEFNVFGVNAGSPTAWFNKGSSLTVRVTADDGRSKAPVCLHDAGTTGEGNNLTPGDCKVSDGTPPFIEFIESN
jgi:hypothetical protein